MRQEHLDHDAVIRAVVDGESAPQKEHLDQCAACRELVDELQSDLAEVGRRSRAIAPRPTKAFAWSHAVQPAQARPWNWPRNWLWPPAAGAMVAALLLAVVWLGLRPDSPAPAPLRLTETMPLAGLMDAEPEPVGGFFGFLVAENISGQEQDFFSAGDDDSDIGAEGAILWPG